MIQSLDPVPFVPTVTVEAILPFNSDRAYC